MGDDSIRSGNRGRADDGGTPGWAGRPFLRGFTRPSRTVRAPGAIDRPVCRSRRGPERTGAVLQRDGSTFDRSGADDPDADRRLLLRYPLGAAVVRRGPSEPGLPLV